MAGRRRRRFVFVPSATTCTVRSIDVSLIVLTDLQLPFLHHPRLYCVFVSCYASRAGKFR